MESLLSRASKSKRKRETEGERSKGRNKRHSSAPLKPLSCCHARRNSSAHWLRRAFRAPDNAAQQQSAVITAVHEPLPRRVHILHFTVKEQQSVLQEDDEMERGGGKKKKNDNIKIFGDDQEIIRACVERHLQYLGGFMFHPNESQGGTKQGKVIRYRNKRAALGAFLGKMTLVLVSFCTS